MAGVTLTNVVKAYGSHPAVKGISLEIEDRSFVALVGPSGCGKSTTLRMIAGLESISWGEIRIGDRVVNDLPARQRGIAMVFQSYALYPHMTVRNNLCFGLKIAGIPRAEIDRRVAFAAEILQLGPYLDRKPAQLSGGQRQRVAMGRAIVREPDVFLFDEPLSNLDAKLRNQMRAEIKRLHKRLNNTVIYVTHDQIEAMTMADKIVIMRDGRIEQAATPYTVFSDPANLFVAGFIGTPAMNFIQAEAIGPTTLAVPAIATPVELPAGRFRPLEKGQRVTFGVRSEDVSVRGHGLVPERLASFSGEVLFTEWLGNEALVFTRLGETELIARMQQPRPVADGERLEFDIDLTRVHLFDPESGETLRAR